MGSAKYVGRVGALAVALGIGTAVITTPGIAWADETTAGSDAPGDVGAQNTATDNDTQATGDDADTGNITTTTTITQGTTTTVVGGGSTPTVTYGNSGNTGSLGTEASEEAPPPVNSSTEEAAPPVDWTSTTSTPGTTTAVSPPPTATTVEVTTTPVATTVLDAPGTSQGLANPLDLAGVLPADDDAGASTIRDTGQMFAARSFIEPNGEATDLDSSNTLQVSPFGALAALAPPVPTVPPPTLADTVLALPGTILSTALNLITQALAPLIGPGAPADNPVLWAVLAFVRRQFSQGFANSTPVLAPRQTSQDLDDGEVHGTFGGTDADGDTLAYTVPTTGLGAPAHGTVSVDQSTGTYTYKPTNGYVGEDYFFVTASDETATPHTHALGQTHLAAARVDVTVAGAAVNVAPTITATPGADPGTGSTRYTVATADVNGDAVTVTVSQPLHGTIAVDPANSAVYVYTRDPVYAHSLHLDGATAASSDTITFTATDSHGATGTTTVTPAIAALNSAPALAVLTEDTGAANGAVKVTITYADADSDVLKATIATLEHGDLYGSAAGGSPIPTGVTTTSPGPVSPAGATSVLYYVPDPSRPGVETLSITLTDNYGGTVTKTAEFTVEAPPAPVNHAPTLSVTTTPTGLADGSVYVSVTLADADSDPVTLTVSAAEHGYYTFVPGGPPIVGPIKGTANAVPEGDTQSLVYVPDPTRPGVEVITVTATDPGGETITATEQFMVVAPPVGDPQSVGDGDVLQILEIYRNPSSGHLYATVVREIGEGNDTTTVVSVYDATTNTLIGDGYSFDPDVAIVSGIETPRVDDSVIDAHGNVYHNLLLTQAGTAAYKVFVVRPDGSADVVFSGSQSDLPVGLSVSPDGEHVYLRVLRRSNDFSSEFSNTIVDLTTGETVLPGASADVLGSDALAVIALFSDAPVDADGRIYYIDVSDKTRVLKVVDADGSQSAVDFVGDPPLKIGASRDGKHVYAVTSPVVANNATSVSLSLVDVVTNETVALGTYPAGAAAFNLISDMAVSDDGTRVLLLGQNGETTVDTGSGTTQFGTNGVMLVDTRTGSTTQLLITGSATDVTFSADGTKAYVVTAGGGGSIQTVELPDTSVAATD